MKSNRFIQAAPEGFLGGEHIKSVYAGRRGSMAGAFAAAMAATTSVRAQSSKDDPNIVNLPAHTKGLG